MRAAQAMHMLIEVHHLKAIELIRHLLDLLLLAFPDGLHTRSIPLDIRSWGFLVLAASLDGSTWYFSIMDILDPVMTHGARFNLCSIHNRV